MFNKNRSRSFSRLESRDLSKLIETKHHLRGNLITQIVQKLSSFDYSKLSPQIKITDFIGELITLYQNVVDLIDQHFGSARIALHVSQAQETYDRKSSEISRQIEALKTHLSTLVGALDVAAKKLHAVIQKWYWMLAPLWLLASVELVANFKVFAILGGNIASSIAIGALIATFTFFWAHFSPDIVRRYAGANRWKRLLWFFIVSLPLLVVFTGFATLRLEHLMVMNPDLAERLNLNPVNYVVANYLAFATSYLICAAYKPTKDQHNQFKNYNTQLSEISQIEDQINQLNNDQETLTADLNKTKSDYSDALILANQLEQEVVTKYLRAFAELKINLLVKTSSTASGLFDDVDPKENNLSLNYDHISSDMKSSRSSLWFTVVILFLVSVFGSCSQSEDEYLFDYHSYLIDRSDSFSATPDSFYTHFVDGWLLPSSALVGAELEVSSISDRRYNNQCGVVLQPAASGLLYDELAHKSNQDHFVNAATAALNEAVHQKVGTNYSLIFWSLTHHINHLASKSNAKSRNLYVSSDLLEKSSVINLYNTDNLALLKLDPDSMSRLLDRHFELKNLEGLDLHIYFIFSNAATALQDFAFGRISTFLAMYYGQKGIHVSIHPSLNHAVQSQR